MKFQIRRARHNDVPQIMQIMEQARNHPVHPEWFVADEEVFVRKHLDGKGFVMVAEAENKEIAGFFLVKYPEPEENLGEYLGFSKEQKNRTVIMDSAAVAEQYRGNGLQGKMLEKAEEIVDRETYQYLMCTVHPDNRYSLLNMEKHGYQIMKKVKCYGGLLRYILLKEIGAESCQKTDGCKRGDSH